MHDQDTAAHRYESIPINNEDERSGKSEDSESAEILDEVIEEDSLNLDDIKNIKLPKISEDNTSKTSINYGYHPIIDFFGNFRFDTA